MASYQLPSMDSNPSSFPSTAANTMETNLPSSETNPSSFPTSAPVAANEHPSALDPSASTVAKPSVTSPSTVNEHQSETDSLAFPSPSTVANPSETSPSSANSHPSEADSLETHPFSSEPIVTHPSKTDSAIQDRDVNSTGYRDEMYKMYFKFESEAHFLFGVGMTCFENKGIEETEGKRCEIHEYNSKKLWTWQHGMMQLRDKSIT